MVIYMIYILKSKINKKFKKTWKITDGKLTVENFEKENVINFVDVISAIKLILKCKYSVNFMFP